MASDPQPDNDQVTTPIDDREDRQREFTSDSKKCPECGEPIEDVRATCPNCGYEYKNEDYDDDTAGHEFAAGSQVDEHGNEDPEAPVLEPEDEDDDDTSSSSTSGSSDS